jgi:hypothetical protein
MVCLLLKSRKSFTSYQLPVNLMFPISQWQGVLDTTLCDKLCQWLATCRWFSPGPPVSSTNKTDRGYRGWYIYLIHNTLLTTHRNQQNLLLFTGTEVLYLLFNLLNTLIFWGFLQLYRDFQCGTEDSTYYLYSAISHRLLTETNQICTFSFTGTEVVYLFV